MQFSCLAEYPLSTRTSDRRDKPHYIGFLTNGPNPGTMMKNSSLNHSSNFWYNRTSYHVWAECRRCIVKRYWYSYQPRQFPPSQSPLGWGNSSYVLQPSHGNQTLHHISISLIFDDYATEIMIWPVTKAETQSLLADMMPCIHTFRHLDILWIGIEMHYLRRSVGLSFKSNLSPIDI